MDYTGSGHYIDGRKVEARQVDPPTILMFRTLSSGLGFRVKLNVLERQPFERRPSDPFDRKPADTVDDADVDLLQVDLAPTQRGHP